MKTKLLILALALAAAAMMLMSCENATSAEARARAAEAEERAAEHVASLRQRLAEAESTIARVEAERDSLAEQLPSADPSLGGLDSEDPDIGREAVGLWAKKGIKALPKLRGIAFEGENSSARHRAKEAIGQITGQWGSQTDLVWKRSVEDAINPDKPLLVLQLFGSLDEEFC